MTENKSRDKSRYESRHESRCQKNIFLGKVTEEEIQSVANFIWYMARGWGQSLDSERATKRIGQEIKLLLTDAYGRVDNEKQLSAVAGEEVKKLKLFIADQNREMKRLQDRVEEVLRDGTQSPKPGAGCEAHS